MASRMIALALGIGCVAWMPLLPPLTVTLTLLAVFGAALFVLPIGNFSQASVGLLLCLVAGILYGSVHGHQLLQRLLPSALEGEDLRVVGYIATMPDYNPHRGGTYRFDFSAEYWPPQSPDDIALDNELRARTLRLSFAPASAMGDNAAPVIPAQGQRWEFTVRLKRPRSFANPGGFDYAAWLIGRGIDATGYVRDASLLQGGDISIRSQRVLALREKLGASSRYSEGGVLLALAAGDRSNLNDNHWDLFRLTGTSHLMAISGLHIGIAAGLGWMLGRVAFSLLGARFAFGLSPALALILAGAYAWLAGFSLPTQRAFVMVTVGVVALALSRHIGRWQAWSLALLLVLLLNPMASLQAGFWLSFAAVAVLLAVVERDQAWRSLLRAQWVLLLGLSPFSLLFFQQASLLAFPVNLVAVPLFSVIIVPLILLALALEFASGQLADIVWTMADSSLELFMRALGWLAEHGRFLSIDYHPHTAELFALLVCAVLLIVPRAFPARYIALLCLLPLLASDRNQLPFGHYQLKVLDVGQGLSILVQTRNHSLVYDLGPRFSERFNMVDVALLPVLRHSGVNYVDRLIISHGDSDHAGAWQKFLAATAVGDFLAGADLAGARPCVAGQRWHWDGVDFAILSPSPRLVPRPYEKARREGGNDESCVLYIQSGLGRALIPGDIESDVELRLLPALPTGLALLLAPHHGSKTSSSQRFVERLNPELVIFSAGYKHHYGHPAASVQSRYQKQGAELAATAQSGMITARLGPKGLESVQHFRDQHHFYWNRPAE